MKITKHAMMPPLMVEDYSPEMVVDTRDMHNTPLETLILNVEGTDIEVAYFPKDGPFKAVPQTMYAINNPDVDTSKVNDAVIKKFKSLNNDSGK